MKPEFKNELLQIKLETQQYSIQQASREIHDNIGQLLSSTKMLMSVGFTELSTIPDALKTAEQTIGKAIQDLRFLSKSLNKEWLNKFDLIENLEAEKERVNAAGNVQVSFASEFEILPLQSEEQVMLFHLVQEILQNSIKHAAAKNITIQIKNKDNFFELGIKDDGKGFDAEALKKESPGLRNMEYRVQLLNGTMQWKSEENAGPGISILVPYK